MKSWKSFLLPSIAVTVLESLLTTIHTMLLCRHYPKDYKYVIVVWHGVQNLSTSHLMHDFGNLMWFDRFYALTLVFVLKYACGCWIRWYATILFPSACHITCTSYDFIWVAMAAQWNVIHVQICIEKEGIEMVFCSGVRSCTGRLPSYICFFCQNTWVIPRDVPVHCWLLHQGILWQWIEMMDHLHCL